MERQGPLVRLGEGEVGGKARGLPFLDSFLDLDALSEEFAPHAIRIPESFVLATGVFDGFVEKNGLQACLDLHDDEPIRKAFLAGTFDSRVLATFTAYLEAHARPLAVRSSSLSEDAHHHPAAGIYQTIMVPNSDPRNRLAQLEAAVKLVFASTYSPQAVRYLAAHKVPVENEKMAVLLQEVVGERHGDVYYPLVSGVATSVNFFPVGNMLPEDGVATLVLGLGRRVVGGQDGMRFCPRYPTVRPQLRDRKDILRGRQTEFDAVDLRTGGKRLTGAEGETLTTLPIEVAGQHGVLADVADTLDEETGVLFEGVFREGPRVLTFNRFLGETLFPLPRALRRILAATQDGFGAPVEIEFALTMEPNPAHVETGKGPRRRGVLHLLQARPMPAMRGEGDTEIPEVPPERTVLATGQAMGHGSADGVPYVVFVDPADFGIAMSTEAAREVAWLNDRLVAEGRPYALLGPGRWGSSSNALGIPVAFPNVVGACLIAELATREVRIEPSQGSHFFHNVVSRGLFYLTVDEVSGGVINLSWLRSQPSRSGTRWARLIEVPGGLHIRVNGKRRRGIVYLP